MKICYLHIGMNKAGSTSIQHCFRDYRDERVEYLRLSHLPPPYLDNGNHSHHLEMRFRRDVPAHFFSSPDQASRKTERAILRKDFDHAVEKAGHSLVISGEVLFEWGLPNPKRNLARFLQARFDKVQGLVYIREPIEYMRSLVQQRIQMRAPNIRQGLAPYYPRYWKRLRSWESALGKGNLEFIPFDQVARRPQDLLVDFATRTGMDARWVQQRQHAGRLLNNSLSAEAASVLLRYRVSCGPRPPHGKEYSADAKLVSALMSFGQTRFSLGGPWVQRVLKWNRQDIRWVSRRLGDAWAEPLASKAGITFCGWSDFLDYGEPLGPTLAAWQSRAFPKIPVKTGKPEEMLSHLYKAVLNSSHR